MLITKVIQNSKQTMIGTKIRGVFYQCIAKAEQIDSAEMPVVVFEYCDSEGVSFSVNQSLLKVSLFISQILCSVAYPTIT